MGGRNGKSETDSSKKGRGKRRNSSKTGATRRKSSRIAGGRLTIPTGFFSSGVSSGTVSRRTTTAAAATTSMSAVASGNLLDVENRKILDEDLHGLLQPTADFDQPTIAVRSGHYRNVSDYYFSLIENEGNPSSDDGATNRIARTNPTLRTNEEDPPDESPSTDCVWFLRLPRNEQFCSQLRGQVRTVNTKRASLDCVHRIKREIEWIHSCKARPNYADDTKMSSVQKRPVPVDDETTAIIPLVPQSQWVYSTPDKQNMKKFVFEDGSTKFLPAVMHTSKKTKVLYDIKNEYVHHVNLSRYKTGEAVPIDKRYLKTICESSVAVDAALPQAKKKRTRSYDDAVKENVIVAPAPPIIGGYAFVPPHPAPEEYNMFLSKNAEESVDIGEVIEGGSFDYLMDVACNPTYFGFGGENNGEVGHKFNFDQCRSALSGETFHSKDILQADEDKAIPADYQHQLLLATERPSKTTKKVERRHLLKAKCLSFENTPPGAKSSAFEPKKLTSWKSFDYDDLKTPSPPEVAVAVTPIASSLPHTVTSGALDESQSFAAPFSSLPYSCLPSWKFYPRRHFD